jgi:nucleotide-binding universal stress UspA family protein
MKPIRNVLVAFDGSDDSIEALETAKDMTRLADGRLTIAYVNEPIHYTHVVPDVYAQGEITEDIMFPENTADTVLADAKVRLSNLFKTDYEVLSGKPANEIIEFAKKKGMDMIVIGNRGMSGIKKLVMGSVSKKVVDEANCPVLVVK